MLTSDWCKAEWASQFYVDPTNRLGRLLPLRLRDTSIDKRHLIDVPALLQNLAYFDFRAAADYKRELERLVARVRGDPPPRGRRSRPVTSPDRVAGAIEIPTARAEPDGEPETLLSNSLLVTAGSEIWTARTTLIRQLPTSASTPSPPTVVRGGFAHSFKNLHDATNPYRETCSSKDVAVEPMERWVENPTRRSLLVELLNQELVKYLAQFGVAFDRSHDRFVVEPKGDGTRMVRTASGRSRWIVRAPDKDRAGFWIHHAARLNFEYIGARLTLVVDPTLLFTSDGRRHAPRDMVPGLQAKWTGRERNRSILGSILLWIDLLTQGQRRVWIPESRCGFELRRLPLVIRSPKGIAGDHADIKVVRDFVETEFGSGNAPVAFAFLENASASELAGAEDE
jgi:hypothetical protein